MRQLARTMCLTLSLVAAACGTEHAPTPTGPSSLSGQTAAGSAPIVPGPSATGSAAAPTPVAAPAALASLARSSNAFGLALYGEAIRKPAGNLALSPVSLTLALTMTWAGARTDTAKQMQQVLHLEGSVEAVSKSAGELSAYLQDPARPVTLRMANRLFGEKTATFEPAFLDLTQAAFGAQLQPEDFKGSFEPSRSDINRWVSDRTEQRIKDLLPQGAITAETALVLVNAIYFLASWDEAFDAKATAPAKFHLSKTESKDVPTMSHTGQYLTATAKGVTLLELGYKDPNLSMTIVLPEQVDGLGAVEKELSADTLAKWTGALQAARVHVTLPKFEIDPPKSLALKDPLCALGMPLAFDKKKADFSGLAKLPSKDDHLAISDAFHKAFVKIDEKGTEAAGATAVVVGGPGGAAPAKPREVIVDHPFLFFVRERASGLVLFMGRVTDPAVH